MRDLIKATLQTRPGLRPMTLAAQAMELHDGELADAKFKEVFDTLCDVYLETDVVYFLNTMQIEKRKHKLLDPVHAINFALQDIEGLTFLKCWNEGDWGGCAQWPNWKEYDHWRT